MSQQPSKFHISNSKMHDWETMCPIVWKAKHIDKSIEFIPTEDMEWGNYFETLVIGSSIGGKVFSFETSPHGAKMKNSIFKERVEAQAKACRRYLRSLGGRVVGKQEYIQGEVIDANGQVIPIDGTLDIRYQFASGVSGVIDLKFTGDTENDFGKFAWGTPEKMDLSQSKHYGLLHQCKYGGNYPPVQYWVFDKGTEMKQKLIDVIVEEFAKIDHIDRLSRAYNEIVECIALDEWLPKNTFDNCRVCPVKCSFERVMPEFYQLTLN